MDILLRPRLTLRPPLPPDADQIAEWLSDPAVTQMLARVPQPYFKADARDWINKVRQSDDLVFTIHRERLIGVVSLEGPGQSPELGYWLARPAWGKGYTSEAVEAVLAHAMATRGITSVRSSVFIDNPASLRIQHKLGFVNTGTGPLWSNARAAVVQAFMTRLDCASSTRPTAPAPLCFAA
jgi:RimJ/RimL family protein N-acetyltransferase